MNDACVAPTASIIGHVTLSDGASVGYNSVLRGDLNSIRLGGYCGVKDHVVISVEAETADAVRTDVVVGNYSVIGNRSTLHCCEVGHETIVGDQCTLCEGSRVGSGCVLLPRTLVPPGANIPDNQCWGGSPAQFIRDVDEDERLTHVPKAQAYHMLMLRQRSQFQPEGSAYVDELKNHPFP